MVTPDLFSETLRETAAVARMAPESAMTESDPPDYGATRDDPAMDAALAAYFHDTTELRSVEGQGTDPVLERLGDYRIVREIGRGGMGVVYLAEQVSLHRRVALKVLPAHLTLRHEAIARFEAEAASAASLHHPSIVKVYAPGQDQGHHFFAMEFISGSPLHEMLDALRREGLHGLDGMKMGAAVSSSTEETLAQAPTPLIAEGEDEDSDSNSEIWDRPYVETVCRLVTKVADALQHAHEKGVIHRDVKPSNILIQADGQPVLTDFGLARIVGLPGLTETGVRICTPPYASPEQAMGANDAIDYRTDIFSLGVTLYEMLTLKRPFDARTTARVLDRILHRDPPDPRRLNRKVPRDLVTIVMKALEKEPGRRYQTAAAFAADLRAFLQMKPIAARPASIATRTVKLVRRHRVASLVTVAVAVLVVARTAWWFSLPGYVRISTHPAGATIYVGKEKRGVTPKTIEVIPGIDHTIRVEMQGEDPVDKLSAVRTVNVPRNEVFPLPIPLERSAREEQTSEQLQSASRIQRAPESLIDRTADELETRTRELETSVRARQREILVMLAPATVSTPEDLARLKRALVHIRALGATRSPSDDAARFGLAVRAERDLLWPLVDGLTRRSRMLATLELVRNEPTDLPELTAIGELLESIDPEDELLRRRIQGDANLRKLVHLLADARRTTLAGELGRILDDMGDLDKDSPLTQHVADQYEDAFQSQARDLPSAYAAFADGSLLRFEKAIELLKEKIPSKRDELDAARKWLVESNRAEDCAKATPDEAEEILARLRAGGLAAEFQAAARKHCAQLDLRIQQTRTQQIGRKHLASIEAAFAIRAHATARKEYEVLEELGTKLLRPEISRARELLRRLDVWERQERDFARFRGLLRETGSLAAAQQVLVGLTRQWKVARTGLDELLQRDKANHSLLSWRALIGLRAGNYRQALKDAEAAVEANETVDSLMVYGQASYALSQIDAALVQFGRILAQEPENGRALYWRGACRFVQALDRKAPQKLKAARVGAALQDLEHALTAGFESVDVHYQIATLRLEQRPRSSKDAATAARRAIDWRRAFTEDDLIVALGGLRKAVTPTGVRHFRRDLHSRCAEAYRQLEDYANCIEQCDAALAWDPGFDEGYLRRGWAKGKSKDIDGAIADLERAEKSADVRIRDAARKLKQSYER